MLRDQVAEPLEAPSMSGAVARACSDKDPPAAAEVEWLPLALSGAPFSFKFFFSAARSWVVTGLGVPTLAVLAILFFLISFGWKRPTLRSS